MDARYFCVIAAAGSGVRMGLPIPKQYCILQEKSVIEHTLEIFFNCSRIEKIVVVIAETDQHWQTLKVSTDPRIITTFGGKLRHQSICNALLALSQEAKPHDWILVHDAARPCLHPDDLHHLIETLSAHPVGGLLGTRVRDTLKQVSGEYSVEKTAPREALWHALTPQMFRYELLSEALHAVKDDSDITDDAAAIERYGAISQMVEGRSDNIKITRAADLALAQMYLSLQKKQESLT